MNNRREFLQRTVGGGALVAGLATTAGCLDVFDDDDTDDSDVGDRFYDGFADPTATVSPQYYVGYDYDAATLLAAYDASAVLPRAAGDFFANVVPNVDGVDEGDIDRILANRYRQIGSAGAEEFDIAGPEGQGLHASGTFDADPFVEFFESDQVNVDSFGDRDGYLRFGTQQPQATETFAVADDSFVFGERVNIQEPDPASVIDAELDGVIDRGGVVRDLLPEFVAGANLVEGETVHTGVQYDLVPLGADTGTPAFDEAVIGLSATGLGVTLEDEEATIERGLVYLTDEYVDETAVRDALDVAADGDGPVAEPPADWETTPDGRTIRATATVNRSVVDNNLSLLRTPFPVPGYDDAFRPVNPSQLGREPVPLVAITASIDDGQVELEYVDGDDLDDLAVRYVHDGERRSETWSGPVTPGDTFETSDTVDSDTLLYVVWEPDTVNAAVLFRADLS